MESLKQEISTAQLEHDAFVEPLRNQHGKEMTQQNIYLADSNRRTGTRRLRGMALTRKLFRIKGRTKMIPRVWRLFQMQGRLLPFLK
jgi:hypothetical protein